MVTEEQLTVKAVVLLQKWVTVRTHRHAQENKKWKFFFFYLFCIYLPFATFMSPKDLHTFLLLLLLFFFC